MTDSRVKAAHEQMEEEFATGDRIEARMKEILPEVLANPSDHDIDVDLTDSEYFLTFLHSTLAKPKGIGAEELLAAYKDLKAAYYKLAYKRAESLAQDEIYQEDNDAGYTG